MATEQKTLEEFLSDASSQMKTAMETLDTTISKMIDQGSLKKTVATIEDKASETGLGEGFEDLAVTKAGSGYRNLKENEHTAALYKMREVFQNLFMVFQSVQQRALQVDNLFYENIRHRDQLFNAYLTHYTTQLSDERVQKSAIRTPEIQGGTAQGK